MFSLHIRIFNFRALLKHFAGSFAGLGFLSFYLSGKIKAFDRKGHVAKLCIVFLPLLAASLVAISRVDDYWHHWQDVFTGGLIGSFLVQVYILRFFYLSHLIIGVNSLSHFTFLRPRSLCLLLPAVLPTSLSY